MINAIMGKYLVNCYDFQMHPIHLSIDSMLWGNSGKIYMFRTNLPKNSLCFGGTPHSLWNAITIIKINGTEKGRDNFHRILNFHFWRKILCWSPESISPCKQKLLRTYSSHSPYEAVCSTSSFYLNPLRNEKACKAWKISDLPAF